MHTAKGFLTAQHGKRIYLLAILALLLFVLLLLDIFLGSVTIAPSDVVNVFFGNGDNSVVTIVLKFRLPKAITAILVGMALSMSGLQMQTFFRNPMAGPYVLGVSSGASLGVAIVIMGFYSGIAPADLMTLGNWVLTLAAWLGAGAVMILIMAISVRIKDVMTILIIGIMLASGLSAVVSILQYFSNETMLKAYVVWTMGSLGNLSSGQLKVLAITVITGIILSIFLIKVLNALQMGENYASSVGVNIRLARVIVFACSCILAGSVTAFCGPIGFIGIAIPHIVRNLFRTSDHKILVPGSIITGGVVMLLCDIISQLPGSDRVLPVNSVTALVGIPVVIWIVIRNKKISGISDE